MSCLLTGLQMSFGSHAAIVELNFDMLFPITWYQKGLASIINVWHMITQVLEANSELLPFDLILGKLAFGQFCFEHMQKEEQTHDEDRAYCIGVLSKVQSLLAPIVVTPAMRDRADCIGNILSDIQKICDPLEGPADI